MFSKDDSSKDVSSKDVSSKDVSSKDVSSRNNSSKVDSSKVDYSKDVCNFCRLPANVTCERCYAAFCSEEHLQLLHDQTTGKIFLIFFYDFLKTKLDSKLIQL
jgi:hypothetical protein